MESSLSSVQVVRLMAEENRRKIVAALILSDAPPTADQLCAATGLSMRSVVDAVDRLVTGGLVERHDQVLRLDELAFQHAARAESPPAAPSEYDGHPADVARVLDVAFKAGKLVQWPSKHSKRLVVLDHLAQHFEIGKRYTEREVNDILRVYNDDVATMRRYLVDEQFLDRGAGDYWRCGGSV